MFTLINAAKPQGSRAKQNAAVTQIFSDMHITGDRPVEDEINECIVFFNEQRPAYSLGYLTPKQYRESFSDFSV